MPGQPLTPLFASCLSLTPLAPTASGRPAHLDPALTVTLPPNLEVGYVPIVTRQAPEWGTLHSSHCRAS